MREEAFAFQPLTVADLPMLHDRLSRPHVARGWGAAESVEALHAAAIAPVFGVGVTDAFIAQYAGRARGYRAAGFLPVGEVQTPEGAALRMKCWRPGAQPALP